MPYNFLSELARMIIYLHVVLRLSTIYMKLAMSSAPERVSFESRHAEV